MTEYKIEKGVPIPPPLRGTPSKHGHGLRASMRRMEVNDSMLVTPRDQFGLATHARALGIICVSRKTENGVRIWRVA